MNITHCGKGRVCANMQAPSTNWTMGFKTSALPITVKYIGKIHVATPIASSDRDKSTAEGRGRVRKPHRDNINSEGT